MIGFSFNRIDQFINIFGAGFLKTISLKIGRRLSELQVGNIFSIKIVIPRQEHFNGRVGSCFTFIAP